MIDWTRINELRNEVGVDDFGEVLEEVDEVIERLEISCDRSKLEHDLHFLKGSSMNLGFASFSSLCQLGEKASAEGNADSVDVGEILASYKASRAAFIAQNEAALQN